MAARLDELNRFVHEALSRKFPRPEIERVLLTAGWRKDQVDKALSTYADVAFPLPVPRPVHHLSAGEAFAYLVLYTALGISAFSVVELFFTLIDFSFYDPTDASAAGRGWMTSTRWAVARVVIAAPVFLFAAWWTGRTLSRDPAERTSPIRRWLTYVAMFIAVCVIIGDFVTLVAYVLAGETTTRFLLKVAIVAIIAGIILGYYLWDMRETARERKPSASYALLAVAIAVAGFAAGAGVWMIGSPASQAELRIDERRVSELGAIARSVEAYYERNDRLPESLTAMKEALGTDLAIADPETGEAYEYRATTAEEFVLCATFAQASERAAVDATWTHGAGHRCFTLNAGDEDRR
jgi:hypothetical protein